MSNNRFTMGSMGKMGRMGSAGPCLFGLIVGLCLLGSVLSSRADRTNIDALVTFTNVVAGVTNGGTITGNGDTRLYTNGTLNAAAIWIQSTNVVGWAATNTWLHLNTYRFANVDRVYTTNTNQIVIQGALDQALSVTLSSGIGTVSYSTQVWGTVFPIVGPNGGVPTEAGRTNNVSRLIDLLSDTGSRATNAVENGIRALSNLLDRISFQIASNKTFYTTTNVGGLLDGSRITNAIAIWGSNGTLTAMTFLGGTYSGFLSSLTNGALYSNAIHWTRITNAFGIHGTVFALTNGIYMFPTLSNGWFSGTLGGLTNGFSTNLVLVKPVVSNLVSWGSLSIGDPVTGRDDNWQMQTVTAPAMTPSVFQLYNVDLLDYTFAQREDFGSITTWLNSGTNGGGGGTYKTTNAGLFYATGSIGSPAITSGVMVAASTMASNLVGLGTNRLDGDVSIRRQPYASVANGHNRLDLGTNIFLDLSGAPSATWQLSSIVVGGPTAARDGQLAIIRNGTGYNADIVHDDPNEATAPYRISTATATNVAWTNGQFAWFIYSTAAARWHYMENPVARNLVAGTTNAISTVWSNSVVVSSVATNLNIIEGSGFRILITNINGRIDAQFVNTGSGTNTLFQTNGVNLGSAGTVNFIGSTGMIAGANATIGIPGTGGGGGGPLNPSQFLPTTVTNFKSGAMVTNVLAYMSNATAPAMIVFPEIGGGTNIFEIRHTNAAMIPVVFVNSNFIFTASNAVFRKDVRVQGVFTNWGATYLGENDAGIYLWDATASEYRRSISQGSGKLVFGLMADAGSALSQMLFGGSLSIFTNVVTMNSNLAVRGHQTNTLSVNVAGGQTNWSGMRVNGTLDVDNVTSGGTLRLTGGAAVLNIDDVGGGFYPDSSGHGLGLAASPFGFLYADAFIALAGELFTETSTITNGLTMLNVTPSRAAEFDGGGRLTNEPSAKVFNIARTGALTNLVSLSTSNATSKPLTNSYANGVPTFFGLEAGANTTITPNGSNLVVATTGGSGGGETNAFYVLAQATNALPNGVVVTSITNGWLRLQLQSCILPTNNMPGLDTGSNYLWRMLFDDTTDETAYWDFVLPDDYGTNAALICTYSTLVAGASLTNVFHFATQVVKPLVSNNINVDSFADSGGVTNVIPTVNGWATNFSGNLSISAVAGDFVRLRVNRDANNADDSSTGDTALHAINIRYTKK